jgi:hypothetical protein
MHDGVGEVFGVRFSVCFVRGVTATRDLTRGGLRRRSYSLVCALSSTHSLFASQSSGDMYDAMSPSSSWHTNRSSLSLIIGWYRLGPYSRYNGVFRFDSRAILNSSVLL